MIKGFGDLLAGLMAMLGLDKLWGSIKGLFGMKSEEKKDEKTLAEEGKKKGEKILDTAKEEVKKVPEKMEVLSQKYWESFVKSGWIRDPQKQKAEFEKIFKKNFDK
jgi:hypothetical protein